MVNFRFVLQIMEQGLSVTSTLTTTVDAVVCSPFNTSRFYHLNTERSSRLCMMPPEYHAAGRYPNPIEGAFSTTEC